MDAGAISAREMFEGKVHYEIPAFQRPYVWNEEDQWAPLWADIIRVAHSRMEADSAGDPKTPHHFLGAVVYELKSSSVGKVAHHLVIDGQQRATTLQLMLDAVQAVFMERGHAEPAEDLEDLILNPQTTLKGLPQRFKLWPSKQDRDAFVQAMDPKNNWKGGDHRILSAHDFFSAEARRWLAGETDDDGALPVGDEPSRAAALAFTLQHGLYLVSINLTGHDDSQLIFETLNDRGTPLLKADLIKNWVFQQGQRLNADVEVWADEYWLDFDDDWWRAEITTGRLSRSRIDMFLQYWLTMRRRDEVRTEHIFRIFTEYATPAMKEIASGESLLRELRSDAETYRALNAMNHETPAGSFYRRVVEEMQLSVTSPLLMWLISENHNVPEEQMRLALASLESWVIRRTLLRMTTKDINRTMVSILKLLDRAKVDGAGETVRNFLAAQRADARLWPTDEKMLAELPRLRMYGYLRQSRLRVVLEAVERKLRTQFHESVALPSNLEIEHVMPQSWHAHWNTEPRLSPEAVAARDRRVQTFGNLTLVSGSLNGSLSNRPWTDSEAANLKSGGHAGLGKRSLLGKYSLLVLSKDLINEHPDAWTDADIERRSQAIVRHICEVWAGPPTQTDEWVE